MVGLCFLNIWATTNMAERKRCQGLNSKCFLVTYLLIVGFLLVLWFNRTDLLEEDLREIPPALDAYLISPPKAIELLPLTLNSKQVLTSDLFNDKWTLVYFSHGRCLPACLSAFEKLASFQTAYANLDIDVLLINVDTGVEAEEELAALLQQYHFHFSILAAEEKVIAQLSKRFIALYLRTDFNDGSYLIEQEHTLFLVDPKSRVYAAFPEQILGAEIESTFASLRSFYAKSE